MPILFEGRGWKKKPGWFSETWNFLSGIYGLLLTQASALSSILQEVQSIRTSQTNKATRLPVYTVKMVEADTEYSQRLPEHTKGYTIQTTDGTAFRFSSEPGRVAKAKRPYWSVPANTSDDENDLDLTNTTFYFASSTPDKTIEIKVKV